MDKYLIVYGDDNSLFYTTAPNFMTAFFEFAKYTGTSFEPVVEKAIRAMITPSDIIELYNHFTSYCDEIQKVFKIESVIYPEVYAEQKEGDSNG